MALPGSFSVEKRNPEYDDPSFIQVIEQEFKELCWWQPDAFGQLKDVRFGLCVAFCGSGKSLLQVALGIYDVVQSNYQQKQLVIVPQQHIAGGFIGEDGIEYTSIKMPDGEKYQWKPTNYCATGQLGVLQKLKKWLLTPGKVLAKKQRGSIISGLNAITSHQALGLVWGQLTNQEKTLAIHNLTLRADEFHHIKGVFEDDDKRLTDVEKVAMSEESTNLGNVVRFILNSDDTTTKVCGTTATPYRGDKGIILSASARAKFSIYNLDWIEHWQTLDIAHFEMKYEEYDGNPIAQVLSAITAEPDKKHMIIVPSSTHKWRFVGGERQLQPLFDGLNDLVRQKVIPLPWLDLVTKNTQDQNKAKLLREPKTAAKGESKFSVVVTCMLGREGTDWCPCARLHNTACENSITLAIQTMGRPFRRFAGKEDVFITYHVQRFVQPKKGMTKRDLLSDRTNALLICIQMDDMANPILLTKMPKGKSVTAPTRTEKAPSLAEFLGDKYQVAIESLIEGIEALEDKSAEAIDEVIEGVLDNLEISNEEDRESVKQGLRTRWLRSVSQEMKELGVDVAFIRQHGFDKIVEGYNLRNKSIYFGDISTPDWEIIREIYREHAPTPGEKHVEEVKNLIAGELAEKTKKRIQDMRS